jgi:hypothetical protein
VTETWTLLMRTLGRFRGAVLAGIACSTAVALTLDPSANLARSSMRFSLWFAIAATTLAVALTAAGTIAELRGARPQLPRAVARRFRD